MIKRLSTIILILLLSCSFSWADEEYDVVLDNSGEKDRTIELPYGNVSLSLKEYYNTFKVDVSIENTTTKHALLLFKESLQENYLKKIKPKIEFEKTFPGDKGKRCVSDCKALYQPVLVIIPLETSRLFSVDVTNTPKICLRIPVYQAKYDFNKLTKKGKYNIDYKILEEDVVTLNIQVRSWSENDPEYMSVKNAVNKYKYSLQSAAFCKNKKHIPDLSEQQRPYRETKDSLVKVINTTLANHPEWYAVDKPHIAYSNLIKQLAEINLDDHNYDCGKHKKPIPDPNPNSNNKHHCSYCNLSEQQIYYQLDDLYQQMRNGKVSKQAAANKATALYNCYQKSSKRNKTGSLGAQISKFYNGIVK